MNTSRRTRIIAQGIYLWAEVQDMPISLQARNDEQHESFMAWEGWSERYPAYVQFVKDEQFKLFDRVNYAF